MNSVGWVVGAYQCCHFGGVRLVFESDARSQIVADLCWLTSCHKGIAIKPRLQRWYLGGLMEAFREGLYMSWNSLMTALCYCLLTLVWKRLTLKMNLHLLFSFFFCISSLKWFILSHWKLCLCSKDTRIPLKWWNGNNTRVSSHILCQHTRKYLIWFFF